MVKTGLDRQEWVRRAAACVVALAGLLWALGGHAADQAQFNPLGYSQDGRYFAFEQYGIQDGSGFPYSDIFLIDLETDSWVTGTPVRVRVDDEQASLDAARTQAQAEAASVLDTHDISRPAIYAAMRADGELDDEGLAIEYGVPGFGFDAPLGRYRLNLEIFKAPSTQDCMEWFGEVPMGYGLIREVDGIRTEIHRDTSVPASRNCTITYKFYAVLVPFEAYSHDGAVAVLSVWSFGFEGPDRRFIALPVGR